MNRIMLMFYALLLSTLMFQNCAKNSFTPETESKDLPSTNVDGQGTDNSGSPIQPEQFTQIQTATGTNSQTNTNTSSGTSTSTATNTSTSSTSTSTSTSTITSTSTSSNTSTSTGSTTTTNTNTSTVTNLVCPTSGSYSDAALSTYLQKSYKIIGIYGLYQGRFPETAGFNYWNSQDQGFENLHYYMQTQEAGQQAVQGYYTNIPASLTGATGFNAFVNSVYANNWKMIPDSSIGDTGLDYWSGITAGTITDNGNNSTIATGSSNPVVLSVQTLSYMYQAFFESMCNNNAANANKRVVMIRRMVFINALRGAKYFVDHGIANPGIYSLQSNYRDMINSTYAAIKDLNTVAAMSTAAEAVYQSKISGY